MPNNFIRVRKMIVMGIRSAVKEVYISIIDIDEKDVINCESLNLPRSLDTPSRFKYLRNTILDIIREYNVTVAGIRIMEETAQTKSVHRIGNEAIIQESFSSSEIRSYYLGKKSGICSRLGITKEEFDSYTSGAAVPPFVTGWDNISGLESIESILVGLGAAAC